RGSLSRMRLLLLFSLVAAAAAHVDITDWKCNEKTYNETNKTVYLQEIQGSINECCANSTPEGELQKCLDEVMIDSGRFELREVLNGNVKWDTPPFAFPPSLSIYKEHLNELRENCRSSQENIDDLLKNLDICISRADNKDDKKCTCESSFFDSVSQVIYNKEQSAKCHKTLGQLRAILERKEEREEQKEEDKISLQSFNPLSASAWQKNWICMTLVYLAVATAFICFLAGCIWMCKLKPSRKESDPIGTKRVNSKRSSRSGYPTKSVETTRSDVTRTPPSPSEASSVSPTESTMN
ncbi:hypothetical protein PENTCL1PPCAC_22360, partial [Pristionchus entomophagus]